MALVAKEIFSLLMPLPGLISHKLLTLHTPASIRVSGAFPFLLASRILLNVNVRYCVYRVHHLDRTKAYSLLPGYLKDTFEQPLKDLLSLPLQQAVLEKGQSGVVRSSCVHP